MAHLKFFSTQVPHVYFMPASSLQAEKMADLEVGLFCFGGSEATLLGTITYPLPTYRLVGTIESMIFRTSPGGIC